MDIEKMHAWAITLPFSSEGRLEKYARTKMAILEEQWLMQTKMLAASCEESNFRRKWLYICNNPFYPGLPYHKDLWVHLTIRNKLVGKWAVTKGLCEKNVFVLKYNVLGLAVVEISFFHPQKCQVFLNWGGWLTRTKQLIVA